MTFQRVTASRIARFIRRLRPRVKVVVGGYDPSLAPEAYAAPESEVDFIVRGEGEATFRALLRSLESGQDFAMIPGLSWRNGFAMRHNSARHLSRLEDGEIALPDRRTRVLAGYTMLGRQADVVETSRGCTYDCSFCSIIEMRGRNFHTYSIERVIADITDAHAHGARCIFLVDDNITLDVRRFAALCQAIVAAGLDGLDYIVQAMTSAIANHGEELAPLMRKAGVRYVFLGIENVVAHDLAFLRAAAKNSRREGGRHVGNAALDAIEILHRHHMLVVGGLIIGNPDDTPVSIDANLQFARQHIDWPYIQHPTPYPGTPMTADFRARGLLLHERVEEYDGTTAVVRSETLPADEIEFARWKADRWMKVRHVPAVFVHDPWFVLRHTPQMLAHTFRGCSWRTFVGLEDARQAFERYRRIRRSERKYMPAQHDEPSVGDLPATACHSPAGAG